MKGRLKKAFTLVEILFVVSLISIVIGIGISQMGGATDAAELANMKADARTAIAQQQIDFANNGEYTSTAPE